MHKQLIQYMNSKLHFSKSFFLTQNYVIFVNYPRKEKNWKERKRKNAIISFEISVLYEKCSTKNEQNSSEYFI